MTAPREVVITGIGVLSPLGIGHAAYRAALESGQSGVRRFTGFGRAELAPTIAGIVPEFDPKMFVPQRKVLKLMARDSILAVSAARLALDDARLAGGDVDPERLGVVLGADPLRNELAEISDSYRLSVDAAGQFQMGRFTAEGMSAAFPLGFLKVLPNMLASHISILHDARGPNNTIYHNELSSLLAVTEAARVIQRGRADVMLAGGASSRLHPLDWVRASLNDELSSRVEEPERASRPFDARRDGQVRGEGAAVLVLESAERALARGATIYGRILGAASASDGRSSQGLPGSAALGRAIDRALQEAGTPAQAIGHINAHGLSTRRADHAEALALSQVLPKVPVTAPKSYFGNLGAAGGVVELVASLLRLSDHAPPPTLNYEQPDPDCPLTIVEGQRLADRPPTAVAVNLTRVGQAAALIVSAA